MSAELSATERVEGWAEQHLKAFMQELGVSHWHVYLRVEPLEQPENGSHTVHMTCTPDSDYWLATIRIDPEHNDSEARFVENLTHELLHLHLATLDKFYGQVQRAFYQSDPSDKQARIEDMLVADFTSAVERSIRSLEGMVMRYREGQKLEATADGAG